MGVYKIDNFMVFQISTCYLCNDKKVRVQKWDKLVNAWLCLKCWKQILNDGLSDEIKIDKNGIEYVEYKFINEQNKETISNIAILDIIRKLKQIESVG
ncbi:hypothetical protein [Spiroplasma sp. DGKH1]|uniref:hypothetical protein n=1 Tax=Spiroplasma sp. DGKH1 TaxID=3050074 RepID=UPI0034C5C8F9